MIEMIRAGEKPAIGMIQFNPLPDSSRWRGGDIGGVLDFALEEAELLVKNGIKVLMVQNLHDIPVAERATLAQVAWTTRVVNEIRNIHKVPVGLNFQENDAEAMFAVASAADVDFVRIKIYVGGMMAPWGPYTSQAHTAIKARIRTGADKVAIFADVHDRTGTPMINGGFEQDVAYAVELNGADGLVLTGKDYAQTLDYCRKARGVAGDVPILVGGSVNGENWSEVVSVADGAIVSSCMKGSGKSFGKLDPEKIRSFAAAIAA
ncbi:MAG: hypothetical protein DI556_21050 [Rhodovulum sulfidophilum]|uniref:BtpA/SgcQ family protein n=1 Tax=Rhodovulum sulfidophilum TaxID=35806 RepID=A0A2W5N615_RHOSU|nr:MAG: hypothetical protein DI556_21050 [Rhodovulum sulfidophilum]